MYTLLLRSDFRFPIFQKLFPKKSFGAPPGSVAPNWLGTGIFLQPQSPIDFLAIDCAGDSASYALVVAKPLAMRALYGSQLYRLLVDTKSPAACGTFLRVPNPSIHSDLLNSEQLNTTSLPSRHIGDNFEQRWRESMPAPALSLFDCPSRVSRSWSISYFQEGRH